GAYELLTRWLERSCGSAIRHPRQCGYTGAHPLPWCALAAEFAVPLRIVETICSHEAIHRSRTRAAAGHSWLARTDVGQDRPSRRQVRATDRCSPDCRRDEPLGRNLDWLARLPH